MRIQSLLLSRSEFPRARSALAWARQHGFKAASADTTANYHRVRQESPKKFTKSSFRVIEFRSGVKAVVAHPKK